MVWKYFTKLNITYLSIYKFSVQLCSPFQASTEDDTSYSPVSDKEKDDPQNGTYIGLSTKSEPQAWGRRKVGKMGFSWAEKNPPKKLKVTFCHQKPSRVRVKLLVSNIQRCMLFFQTWRAGVQVWLLFEKQKTKHLLFAVWWFHSLIIWNNLAGYKKLRRERTF